MRQKQIGVYWWFGLGKKKEYLWLDFSFAMAWLLNLIPKFKPFRFGNRPVVVCVHGFKELVRVQFCEIRLPVPQKTQEKKGEHEKSNGGSVMRLVYQNLSVSALSIVFDPSVSICRKTFMTFSSSFSDSWISHKTSLRETTKEKRSRRRLTLSESSWSFLVFLPLSK